MAKDDYHVIVYKILAYLYQCLKKFYYLNKFSPSVFTYEPLIDIFTEKKISDADNGYSDGEYEWYDSDIYYFEHYNLKIDENFVKKIVEN